MVPLENGVKAKRSKCPDCEKKGVTVRFTAMDGDALGCRYCAWWAFMCNGGTSDYEIDRIQLMRWENINDNPGYWNFDG